MFSWTQTATSSDMATTSTTSRSNGTTSPKRSNNRISLGSFGGNVGMYPAHRGQYSFSNPIVVTGQAVNGSIRPPPTMTRAQHLKSYVEDATLARSTRMVHNDETTYDTVFQTTEGDTLILRVHVPPSDNFLPTMSLAGVRARHAWLDKLMRIEGYNPIQSESAWRASGLSLGEAVHAVVKQLQLNPPNILEITDKGLQSIQRNKGRYPQRSSRHSTSSSTTNGHGRPTSQPPREEAPPDYQTMLQNERKNHQRHSYQGSVLDKPMPKINMPTIPKSFSEADSCTRDELETLLRDELTFLQFVAKLKPTTELNKLNHSFLKENVKMATTNQDQETVLRQRHAEVKQLQRQLQDQISTFQELERQQDEICKPPDVTSAMQQLNLAKKETFETSEQYAEEWVENGDVSVDDFCKQFLQQRKEHHLRAAQVELLEQQHQRQRRQQEPGKAWI